MIDRRSILKLLAATPLLGFLGLKKPEPEFRKFQTSAPVPMKHLTVPTCEFDVNAPCYYVFAMDPSRGHDRSVGVLCRVEGGRLHVVATTCLDHAKMKGT